MSRNNSEVALAALEAFEADGARWIAALDPEIAWYPLEEGNLPSYGHEGAQRVRDRWMGSWDTHRIEVEDVAANAEHVVTTVHVFGQGAGSGVAVDVRMYLHWKVRDGKIVYLFEHADRTAAYSAAGIDR